MTIAIIADALDNQYAGIYIYTKEIIRALAKEGPQHQFVVIREKAGKSFGANVETIILPVKKIPFYTAYRLFVEIPRLLTRKKVDVVIEPRHLGPFNLPKHIQRITVIHDLTPLLFPAWHPVFNRNLQKLLLPAVLKKTDLIVTNSEYTRKDVIQYFPKVASKVYAVPLGKEELFQPKHDKAVLEKYKIRTPYILYVGTLEPRKNLKVLLRAYQQLRLQSGFSPQLVIVGKKGWKNDALFAALKTSGFQKDILLTGYVAREDLPAIYTQAHCFVYPSLYEGFGLPMLEAMSCGTAVVASNTSSLPEVGGQAALYFEPNDEKTLLKHLVTLFTNQAIKQKMEAATLVQAQKFSWSVAARQLLAL